MQLIYGMFLILVCVCVVGCGKSSGLEGKVVDGKGKPIASLKVIANQAQPIKGYEQFETTTGADGKFSFGKLYPNSGYTLSVWHKNWTTKDTMGVRTAPEGETSLLKEALVVSQARNSAGKLVDPQTGLA
jgi:hypothetical protein